jgi:outer membrane lipoprotein SlyB
MLRYFGAVLAITSLVFSGGAIAQKSGQSARITVGKVEQAKPVQLDSNAGGGALVGGALGWAATRNKSSAKQLGGAALGAAAGGAVANRSQGDRSGVQYVVRTGDGSAVTIVSDQTQIAIGDCVTVEEHSKGANIRRIDPSACAPKSEQVISSLEEEMQEEAAECATAKDELLAAETADQFELAKRKMDILCNS